jgi:3-methyladenine DNA glycosylase AlkD
MKLIGTLRRELAAVADPVRAPQMQAYMKSAMPYHGVPAPLLRKVARGLFAESPLASAEAWREAVLGLWRGARFREERYAAMVLAGDRRARGFRTLDALPMYEEMIVTGAWWDLVDELASHRLGELLTRYPREMTATMLAWSRSSDLWKRRSAIICQLKMKRATDLDLLYACIEPAVGEREFFLRKAIGWALRQYAWTDPDEILRYVRTHADVLSPLSKREALKNLLREGRISKIP